MIICSVLILTQKSATQQHLIVVVVLIPKKKKPLSKGMAEAKNISYKSKGLAVVSPPAEGWGGPLNHLAAKIPLQGLRQFNAVFILVVFQQAGQNAGQCQRASVE